MPKKDGPKTLEQFRENALRMYKNQPQWSRKIAKGELTHQDITRMAYETAQTWYDEQQDRLEGTQTAQKNMRLPPEDVEAYRQTRLSAYLENFDWNEALDKASLDALVELEVQLHIIKHDLQMPKLSTGDKGKLVDAMMDLSMKSADLRTKLGVDRKSRELAKTNKSPVEKMDEQVSRFALFMKERIERFPEVADNVDSERNLREAARYFLGLDFRFVDAIMVNTKRLNDLEPVVEQYD